MNTKVLLVDDHPLLRDGIRQAIQRQPDLTVVGETSTAAEATRLVAELSPDLVMLDIHLPDGSGLEVARQILANSPAIKIMILSADPDRLLVDEALKLGVRAYLLKQCLWEEVVQAINFVISGKLYLSPEVNAGILQDYRSILLGKEETSKPLLSERDRQLLHHVAEGRRNKEIAAQMDLGIKAVEVYRSRLMKKLGCSSPAELVRFAIREGLITP